MLQTAGNWQQVPGSPSLPVHDEPELMLGAWTRPIRIRDVGKIAHVSIGKRVEEGCDVPCNSIDTISVVLSKK